MMKEFTKGDTLPVGDCGNFECGINHLTKDGNCLTPSGVGSNPDLAPVTWWQRIVVYGNSATEAELLRDRIIAALEAYKEPEDPKSVVLVADPQQGTIQRAFEFRVKQSGLYPGKLSIRQDGSAYIHPAIQSAWEAYLSLIIVKDLPQDV